MRKLKDTLSTLLVVRAFYDVIYDSRTKATEFIDKIIETKFLEKLFDNFTLIDASLKSFSGALTMVN